MILVLWASNDCRSRVQPKIKPMNIMKMPCIAITCTGGTTSCSLRCQRNTRTLSTWSRTTLLFAKGTCWPPLHTTAALPRCFNDSGFALVCGLLWFGFCNVLASLRQFYQSDADDEEKAHEKVQAATFFPLWDLWCSKALVFQKRKML